VLFVFFVVFTPFKATPNPDFSTHDTDRLVLHPAGERHDCHGTCWNLKTMGVREKTEPMIMGSARGCAVRASPKGAGELRDQYHHRGSVQGQVEDVERPGQIAVGEHPELLYQMRLGGKGGETEEDCHHHEGHEGDAVKPRHGRIRIREGQ